MTSPVARRAAIEELSRPQRGPDTPMPAPLLLFAQSRLPRIVGSLSLALAATLGCADGPESSDERASDEELVDPVDGASSGGTLASGGSVPGATPPEGTGGEATTTGTEGVLPVEYRPLQLTFTYADINPRAAGEASGCSLYDTSDEFRTYFNSKREQMDLVALLFSRIMGIRHRESDVIMQVRAFDYDPQQSDRESCVEVSSPGSGSRGTAFGDIVAGDDIFIDYEPGPSRERVINLLAHEALHGLSLGHDPDEDGLMATTITGDDPFFDDFILNGLHAANIELVDDLPQRLESGERVYMTELLETYLGVRIL